MSIKFFTEMFFLCLDLLFVSQSPWWDLVLAVDSLFCSELVGDLCCTASRLDTVFVLLQNYSRGHGGLATP